MKVLKWVSFSLTKIYDSENSSAITHEISDVKLYNYLINPFTTKTWKLILLIYCLILRISSYNKNISPKWSFPHL